MLPTRVEKLHQIRDTSRQFVFACARLIAKNPPKPEMKRRLFLLTTSANLLDQAICREFEENNVPFIECDIHSELQFALYGEPRRIQELSWMFEPPPAKDQITLACMSLVAAQSSFLFNGAKFEKKEGVTGTSFDHLTEQFMAQMMPLFTPKKGPVSFFVSDEHYNDVCIEGSLLFNGITFQEVYGDSSHIVFGDLEKAKMLAQEIYCYWDAVCECIEAGDIDPLSKYFIHLAYDLLSIGPMGKRTGVMTLTTEGTEQEHKDWEPVKRMATFNQPQPDLFALAVNNLNKKHYQKNDSRSMVRLNQMMKAFFPQNTPTIDPKPSYIGALKRFAGGDSYPARGPVKANKDGGLIDTAFQFVYSHYQQQGPEVSEREAQWIKKALIHVPEEELTTKFYLKKEFNIPDLRDTVLEGINNMLRGWLQERKKGNGHKKDIPLTILFHTAMSSFGYHSLYDLEFSKMKEPNQVMEIESAFFRFHYFFALPQGRVPQNATSKEMLQSYVDGQVEHYLQYVMKTAAELNIPAHMHVAAKDQLKGLLKAATFSVTSTPRDGFIVSPVQIHPVIQQSMVLREAYNECVSSSVPQLAPFRPHLFRMIPFYTKIRKGTGMTGGQDWLETIMYPPCTNIGKASTDRSRLIPYVMTTNPVGFPVTALKVTMAIARRAGGIDQPPPPYSLPPLLTKRTLPPPPPLVSPSPPLAPVVLASPPLAPVVLVSRETSPVSDSSEYESVQSQTQTEEEDQMAGILKRNYGERLTRNLELKSSLRGMTRDPPGPVLVNNVVTPANMQKFIQDSEEWERLETEAQDQRAAAAMAVVVQMDQTSELYKKYKERIGLNKEVLRLVPKLSKPEPMIDITGTVTVGQIEAFIEASEKWEKAEMAIENKKRESMLPAVNAVVDVTELVEMAKKIGRSNREFQRKRNSKTMNRPPDMPNITGQVDTGDISEYILDAYDWERRETEFEEEKTKRSAAVVEEAKSDPTPVVPTTPEQQKQENEQIEKTLEQAGQLSTSPVHSILPSSAQTTPQRPSAQPRPASQQSIRPPSPQQQQRPPSQQSNRSIPPPSPAQQRPSSINSFARLSQQGSSRPSSMNSFASATDLYPAYRSGQSPISVGRMTPLRNSTSPVIKQFNDLTNPYLNELEEVMDNKANSPEKRQKALDTYQEIVAVSTAANQDHPGDQAKVQADLVEITRLYRGWKTGFQTIPQQQPSSLPPPDTRLKDELRRLIAEGFVSIDEGQKTHPREDVFGRAGELIAQLREFEEDNEENRISDLNGNIDHVKMLLGGFKRQLAGKGYSTNLRDNLLNRIRNDIEHLKINTNAFNKARIEDRITYLMRAHDSILHEEDNGTISDDFINKKDKEVYPHKQPAPAYDQKLAKQLLAYIDVHFDRIYEASNNDPREDIRNRADEILVFMTTTTKVLEKGQDVDDEYLQETLNRLKGAIVDFDKRFKSKGFNPKLKDEFDEKFYNEYARLYQVWQTETNPAKKARLEQRMNQINKARTFLDEKQKEGVLEDDMIKQKEQELSGRGQPRMVEMLVPGGERSATELEKVDNKISALIKYFQDLIDKAEQDEEPIIGTRKWTRPKVKEQIKELGKARKSFTEKTKTPAEVEAYLDGIDQALRNETLTEVASFVPLRPHPVMTAQATPVKPFLTQVEQKESKEIYDRIIARLEVLGDEIDEIEAAKEKGELKPYQIDRFWLLACHTIAIGRPLRVALGNNDIDGLRQLEAEVGMLHVPLWFTLSSDGKVIEPPPGEADPLGVNLRLVDGIDKKNNIDVFIERVAKKELKPPPGAFPVRYLPKSRPMGMVHPPRAVPVKTVPVQAVKRVQSSVPVNVHTHRVPAGGRRPVRHIPAPPTSRALTGVDRTVPLRPYSHPEDKTDDIRPPNNGTALPGGRSQQFTPGQALGRGAKPLGLGAAGSGSGSAGDAMMHKYMATVHASTTRGGGHKG